MQFDLQGILNSKRLAISRALSFVENSSDSDMRLGDAIHPHLGKAYRIGVTGPPGAGKSSLVDRLIEHARLKEQKVAVISVDPTSPFSGGAILGDRVRMGRHSQDKGVFIRSMATRGSQGGLSLRAQEAADVFDAAGYDLVIYETVGVGQVELDVAQAADTTMVVLVPESGDDIQAMKAGLMEIADIFVVNKGDRQGANQSLAQIKSMLEMRDISEDGWHPQAVKTSALNAEGIVELMGILEEHKSFLQIAGGLRKFFKDRVTRKIRSSVERQVLEEFWTDARLKSLSTATSEANLGKLLPSDLIKQLLEKS